MRVSIFLILIAILLPCMNMQAQDGEKANSLSLGWGFGHLKIQDRVFSPTIHSGNSPVNAIVSYIHSDKLEQLLYVKLGNFSSGVFEPYSFYWDTPEESRMTWPSSYTHLDINYSLGKSIIQKNEIKWVLGGRSRNRLLTSSNARGPYAFFGYYFSLGLDLWSQLSYTINDRNSFTANLALPVFSFSTRSPYMSQDDWFYQDTYYDKAVLALIEFIKDVKPESWGKSKSLDMDLSYYYSLSEKWDIGATYWFSLNMSKYPRSFTSVENLLTISFKYKF